MGVLTASIMVFCLVGIGLGAIYFAFYGSHRVLRERFEETSLNFRRDEGIPIDDFEGEATSSALLRWVMERMPDTTKDLSAAGKSASPLARAGYTRAGANKVFQLVRIATIGAGILISVAAGLILHYSANKLILAVMASAALGWTLPGYYLSKRGRQRQFRIARQLSDVLDLLVVCVEAGLGLLEAVKVVGEETAHQGQDIGKELSLASGEVAAGLSLGQALRNLADRTGVDDMKPLAATLIQSEQLGAQIGPTLRSSSDMLRNKRRLRAEEAAQKTTVKILFPLVLFILPAMLIVILAPALIQTIRTFAG